MVGVNNFGGALGAAPVPAKAAEGIGADEALSKAKVEFEEQSKASDARSQALQEALHGLKGGMAAGSEAIARVAELEQDLAQKVNAAEEQRQASSSRIAELEAQLAAKMESAQSSNKIPCQVLPTRRTVWVTLAFQLAVHRRQEIIKMSRA